MEKAFVEGRWDGKVSKTEPTRILSKEEPVIQFNNMWNLGLEGNIEVLDASPDGLSQSCKIYLRLARKGTLADAKSPNYGSRLALRTRLASGVFQLADGSHTLLAALPQTLSDEDAHTLLFILSLGKPGVEPSADPPRNGLVTIETYRMPMDDWHRIPQAVRDDHPQLLEKCRAAAGKGRIERIDRIGSCADTQGKMNVLSVVEMSYPTSFGISDQALVSKSWEYRNVGSEVEANRVDRSPLIHFFYGHIPRLPLWNPMLADGTAKDISHSKVPIFGSIRYSGSMLGGDSGRTCLLGIAPIPADGAKPTHLALMFASATVPGIEEASQKTSEILVEVLVLRGKAGTGGSNPESHIKELLANPGSIETIAAATVVSGRTVMSSETEWIYPMGTLGGGDSIVIPSGFDRLNQGTTMSIESPATTGDADVSVNLRLDHSLCKPELPMATNHGDGHLTPEKPVIHDLAVNEKLSLAPGKWTLVKEIPPESILGEHDPSAKNPSCHVFARLAPDHSAP